MHKYYANLILNAERNRKINTRLETLDTRLETLEDLLITLVDLVDLDTSGMSKNMLSSDHGPRL